ncbi:MAG TPA: zinc-ribbon domain-containing protein [Candidatus Bathyarchaeia archaeon]|nr:zinc-ribbon domain-containing protein [Candidatus Bathyarchaeia archaeon]
MGDERDYNLAILVILLLLCWPAALIYYFTRPSSRATPTARPLHVAGASLLTVESPMVNCPQCNRNIAASSMYCTYCGYKLR